MAQNELSKLLASIKENSANFVSLGGNVALRNARGVISDATTLAISLSNAQAKQRDNIRLLQFQLRIDEGRLRLTKEKQAGIETDMDDIAKGMTANNCLM